MQKFIEYASECNAYVIFKDIYSLKFDVLSDFCTEIVASKEKLSTNIFATYTLGSGNPTHIPEILKLAFRPVEIAGFLFEKRFEVILAAMGADCPELAKKLSILVETITKSFNEPLSTAFSFVSLLQLIQSSPITSNNPLREIHERIITKK